MNSGGGIRKNQFRLVLRMREQKRTNPDAAYREGVAVFRNDKGNEFGSSCLSGRIYTKGTAI